MRPRKNDRHLPRCVYLRHGSYWLVKRGSWTRIGATLTEALTEYARLHAPGDGGMGRAVDDALSAHRKKIKPATWAQYQLAADKIKKAFAEFSPEQVKPKHIAQFKQALADRPATANLCLSVLRVVFNHLLELQLVESNPAAIVKRVHEKKRDRLVMPAEFDAIRAHAVPRLQAMMDLMRLTGQRLMDVVTIHESQIVDDGIAFKQAKTGAKLVVRWTPELRAAVARARALNGSVRSLTLFRSKRERSPRYRTVYHQWRAACAAAGITNTQARDLRAMSATAAEAQGLNAQKLLGHTTPDTTRRYLRGRDAPVVDGPSIGQVLELQEKG